MLFFLCPSAASIWCWIAMVIVIHRILTMLNYEIHLHLNSFNPYLFKPTDTPWLYLLQFSPICLMSCVFMCRGRIWVPMHMSTLKWATMSLVAPDDTPANEQLIQPMKFWTDTYLRTSKSRLKKETIYFLIWIAREKIYYTEVLTSITH